MQGTASETALLYHVAASEDLFDGNVQTAPGTLDSWNILGVKTPMKKAAPCSTMRKHDMLINFDLDQDCNEVENEGFILAKS